jgi:hypothetical protein
MSTLNNQIKDLVFDAVKKPRNVAIAIFGLGASYFVYFTVKIYIERRKLRHLPGPPTKGYFRLLVNIN